MPRQWSLGREAIRNGPEGGPKGGAARIRDTRERLAAVFRRNRRRRAQARPDETCRNSATRPNWLDRCWNMRLCRRLTQSRQSPTKEPREGFVHVQRHIRNVQDREPTQVPDRGRSRDRGSGRADRGQGPGPDQHALAEHLALEGYLPRVRARLRQEG